ncbi:nuclear exosome regulator NRDE2 [Daphnia magna]|uniref:nuclear exosome regulator NRDE2 n=1 Tax=Daphnia magna TaxID=35525 RepID=UPI001E1BAAC9|nr:nuclear exosome regulator NRDE2 [Daphnia magna]XP_045026386.1 nuclear exosome regulator NRDE2 [Daphnia magna]
MADQLFYEDLKGDKNNYAFPYMYFKNVARHQRMKGVLGVQHFSKRSSLNKSKPHRYFGKNALRRLTKIANTQPLQPLCTETNPLGIYDSSTALYIQGRKAERTNDEQTQGIKELEMSRQTALFNEKLRENPHNVNLWLSFIEHQNSASFSLMENDSDISQSQHKKLGRNLHRRAQLERKVAILDKAIEHNPKSVKLLTARLNIVAEYWDVSTLHQEWRNVLFLNPVSIELWNEYLNFIENNFEGFSVALALKTYASCFQKLLQMQQPSFASHQRPAHLEEFIIDIASRLCSFLRQCGWIEKSVSLSQALLELCFKRPNDISSPLTWLESLWEARVPRTGEVDFIESAVATERQLPIRAVHGIDALEAEDAIITSNQSFPVIWRLIESLRSREHFQACSSSTDCDDEDRFVSFTDLSPYLFIGEKKNHLQFRLLFGCLVSLGIPILPASQAQLFWAPLVLEDNLLRCLANVPKIASLSSSQPNIVNNMSYLTFLRRIVLQTYRLIKQPYQLELALWWLDVERVRIGAIARSSTQVDVKNRWKEAKTWVKAFLKDVSSSDSVTTLLLYNGYAALELQMGNEEEYRKILSQLMKMYSVNPLLVEQEKNPGLKAALIRIWFSYARSLLRCKAQGKPNQQAALAQLVALGAGSTFSDRGTYTPAMLLKAKRKYQAVLQQMNENSIVDKVSENLTFLYPDELVELLGCYSYFLSLTEGCRSAFHMVEQWLVSSQKRDLHFTAEMRYNIEFVKYHIRRECVYVNLLELSSEAREWAKDIQSRLFHDTICTALAEYPDSMQLLTIFINSEERCSMFSGLWNTLTMRAKATQSKSGSRAALAACLALANREEIVKKGEETTFKELPGCSGGTATLYLSYRRKMEHLAEYCVSQYPGRCVTLLWRILMHSAHVAGNPQRCKELFYRAIRDCPTSKDICMDIIQYEPSSLKEVTNLMTEKDLRLRFPLEELELLLETEKEENADGLHQVQIGNKNDSFVDATAYAEALKSLTSESEDNFSEDLQQDSEED